MISVNLTDLSVPPTIDTCLDMQNLVYFQITGLQTDPFAVPLSVRDAYQGPVRWRKDTEKVKCHFRNLIK